MKECKIDLFKTIYEDDVDAICITTNGQYTIQGVALMSGGCAGTCAQLWPETAKRLGKLLKIFKINIPFVIGALDKNLNYIEPTREGIRKKDYKCLIFSYPTINNIIDGANIQLIKQSATIIKDYADKFNLNKIMTVRFGSGIGGLNWYNDVKPIIQDILDDRFVICSQEYDELYK